MRILIVIACLATVGCAQSIPELALATPPEFAADALLRLLESGKFEDARMAQQAFDLAANAQFRVQMRALSTLPADSREGALAHAYALKLDALSLQSRAVIAMSKLKPGEARDLFRAMVKPELAPVACKDALNTYDVGPLYQALTAVLQTGFTAKERAREDHVSFLLEAVSQVHAVTQAGPMAAVIQSANLTPQQREAVQVRFSGRTEAIATAKPCDPAPQARPYWESAAAQRLMASARQLRFGPTTSKVLSDTERAASEWQQQVEDFGKELAAWEPAAEKSEADYYQQKCIVYQALVELIPPGTRRDRAVQSFVQFVAGSNLQTQNRVEWFVPITAMLERIRNTNNGEPEKFLAALADSSHPVLALYAAEERFLDRHLPTWLTTASEPNAMLNSWPTATRLLIRSDLKNALPPAP